MEYYGQVKQRKKNGDKRYHDNAGSTGDEAAAGAGFSYCTFAGWRNTETGEGIEPPCQCYSIWGKDERCTNCISRKALKEKRQKTKIEIVDSKVYQVISKYLNIDGKPYIMEMINNLEDDDIIDSEDRENLLAELSGYADELYKDALTGVFNRRYYEDKVRNLESSAGVAMVDLDDFKLYNDTYGHDAGDKALKVVVEVIRRHARKTDKVVRFEGDEFLLLIPDINVDNFTKKLKEIQEEVHAARVPGYSQPVIKALWSTFYRRKTGRSSTSCR